MPTVTTLADYSDDRGNKIIHGATSDAKVKINFRGQGNTLTIAPDAKIGWLEVNFDCDNAVLEIGSHHGVPAFRGWIRLGEDATIKIGKNVSCTSTLIMTCVEGATVTLGDDIMCSDLNEIHADDAHPIFDVKSGKRVNPARDVHVGNHVWMAKRSVILSGSTVGDGSVIGFASVVKGRIPNNSIAAGAPAKVVRKNIAWERPHLSLVAPPYKPDASTVKKSPYWNMTTDDDSNPSPGAAPAPTPVIKAARKLWRKARPNR